MWQKVGLNISAKLCTQALREKYTWIVETTGKLLSVGPF